MADQVRVPRWDPARVATSRTRQPDRSSAAALPRHVLALQRSCGNLATTALLMKSPFAVQRQAAPPAGPGPDRCLDLLAIIIELLNEVAQRFNDALDDRHGLFDHHRRIRDAHPEHGSWEGHEQRFLEDRGRLRYRLAEWDADDECRGRQLSSEQASELAEARDFAGKDWPSRPARRSAEEPASDPSTRERMAEALREAGVPAWAVAAVVVLVIAALADPEPFSKLALIIGSAAAIALLILLGRPDEAPDGAQAEAGQDGRTDVAGGEASADA